MKIVTIGYFIPNELYYEYRIWLLQNNIDNEWLKHGDDMNLIRFEDDKDAVAFKLRFGL